MTELSDYEENQFKQLLQRTRICLSCKCMIMTSEGLPMDFRCPCGGEVRPAVESDFIPDEQS